MTKKFGCRRLLLCALKNKTFSYLKFFSDKKNYTVNAKLNNFLERQLVQHPEDVLVIARSFRRMKPFQNGERASFIDGDRAMNGEYSIRKTVHISKRRGTHSHELLDLKLSLR